MIICGFLLFKCTSPLALIRVVWNWSPVPHEGWDFHTRSEGGLWDPPAFEAHIWLQTSEVRQLELSWGFVRRFFLKSTNRDPLTRLQGEFSGKFEGDGSAGSHLALHLPAAQILVLKQNKTPIRCFYCVNFSHDDRLHHLTSSALLLSLTYFPSRSTSSTVTRPLAEACWVMRVRVRAPPPKLEASLSTSLGRRLLAGELWALLWTERAAEAEERLPVTLVGGGLGERRSLQGRTKMKMFEKP